jgi:hypothetical protein
MLDLHNTIANTAPQALGHTGANDKLDQVLDEAWTSFQSECFRQAQPRFGLDDKTGQEFKVTPLKGGDPMIFPHRPNVFRYIAWQRKHIMRAASYPFSPCTRTMLTRVAFLSQHSP